MECTRREFVQRRLLVGDRDKINMKTDRESPGGVDC